MSDKTDKEILEKLDEFLFTAIPPKFVDKKPMGRFSAPDGHDVIDINSEKRKYAKQNLLTIFKQYGQERELAIADWATGGDTGTSSEAIMRHMYGLESNRWGFMAPSDSSDRGRCIRLLNRFPEWWNRLDEMNQYPHWTEQIPLIRSEAETLKSQNNTADGGGA